MPGARFIWRATASRRAGDLRPVEPSDVCLLRRWRGRPSRFGEAGVAGAHAVRSYRRKTAIAADHHDHVVCRVADRDLRQRAVVDPTLTILGYYRVSIEREGAGECAVRVG